MVGRFDLLLPRWNAKYAPVEAQSIQIHAQPFSKPFNFGIVDISTFPLRFVHSQRAFIFPRISWIVLMSQIISRPTKNSALIFPRHWHNFFFRLFEQVHWVRGWIWTLFLWRVRETVQTSRQPAASQTHSQGHAQVPVMREGEFKPGVLLNFFPKGKVDARYLISMF